MTDAPPADREAIAAYFDAGFYCASYREVAGSGLAPIEHYLVTGWRAGFNPSRRFNTGYYLRTNADVSASGANPLMHYALVGKREGRLGQRPLDTLRSHLGASAAPRTRLAAWAVHADRSEPVAFDGLARALGRTAPMVVSVSHDDDLVQCGGIQNVIGDERRAFAEAGWVYLHLSPAAPLPMLADDMGPGFCFKVRLDREALGPVLARDVCAAVAERRAQGGRVELVIHHMMGHAPELLAHLAAAAGARPFVWGHDFFTLCPSYALMRNDVRFCGGPPRDSAACGVCSYGADRQAHLPRMEAFFAGVRPTMLFPSAVALEAWRQRSPLAHHAAVALPLARVLLAAAGGAPRPARAGVLRVAHLGARVGHKGWLVFEALALSLAGDARYSFHQLGQQDGLALPGCIGHVPVRVDGGTRDAMIEAVARHRIDVVVSWSMWPETFCFTVHEALAGGAFVVAREGAGNVWPAVQGSGGQGCAVRDEAGLVGMFRDGDIGTLVAAAERRRGALLRGWGTADWLLGAGNRRVEPSIVAAPACREPDGRSGAVVHCFTTATRDELGRAGLLAETVRRHHPGWILWLCLADGVPGGAEGAGFDHVVRWDGVGLGDLDGPSRDLVPCRAAVRAQMLWRLLEQGAERVVVLASDRVVLAGLGEIEGLLDEHAVILVPDRDAVGAVGDCALLAVASTPTGRRFARWWLGGNGEGLLDESLDVHVVRDPGYDVSICDLREQRVSIDPDGVVRSAGRPIRLLRGIDAGAADQVLLDGSLGGEIEAYEVVQWYRRRLGVHADLAERWDPPEAVP